MIRPRTAASILCLALAGCADDPPTLGELAARSGIHVGTGFVEGSTEPRFRTVAAHELTSATIPLYWATTEPTAGQYDFSGADDAIAFAESHGMRMRGHPLVWGRLTLPSYVQNETDPTTLRNLMVDRITTIVTRYRGRIAQYDVVNEPIALLGENARADGLETYVFLNVLGPDYIRDALVAAHAADPDARLFINDFFVEEPGPKQDRFFELAESLVASGAPLHGVGFQGHVHLPPALVYEPTQDDIRAAIARFAALGLAVEITEVDVTLEAPIDQLELQRTLYRDIAQACVREPACTGLTVWGISDRDTWIQTFFGVDGAPLPWDVEYRPKPAYDGLVEAFREVGPARSTYQ